MRIDTYKLSRLCDEHEIKNVKQLADKAGINYSTLLKSVQRGTFSDPVLEKVCAVFDIFPLELAFKSDTAEEIGTEVINGVEYTQYTKTVDDYFMRAKTPWLDRAAKDEILEARENFVQLALHLRETRQITAKTYDALMKAFGAAECIDCCEAAKSAIRYKDAENAVLNEAKTKLTD